MQVYELVKIGFIFYTLTALLIIAAAVSLGWWIGSKMYKLVRRRKEALYIRALEEQTRATRENRPPDYSKL